jgi:hypothetical protein
MSTRLTLSDARGPLADLLEKLDGPSGEDWMRGFKKFLRKENPWEKLKTFKVIEIGTYKSVKPLRKALEKSGARIGDWAGVILNKTKLSKSKQFLDLVVLTVRELGLPRDSELKDIYEAAKNQGLDLCPAEVGPLLRLQYTDQPRGEWLIIAMEPIRIKDPFTNPFLFHVECFDGDCFLNAQQGYPPNRPGLVYRFVFVRRK